MGLVHWHFLIGLAALLIAAPMLAAPATAPADARFAVGERLVTDDFTHGTGGWISELETPGTVAADAGVLDIDVPAGASIWSKQKLTGPLMIQYRISAISAGGPNDRVSDVNCFWMANDSRTADFFAVPRSGKFADYDQLRTYYVGYGGNSNTTTRFRRYIGKKDNRPMLPENDLKDRVVPDREMLIQLVADDHLIQFYRDGKKLFEMNDPEPYTGGYFAFRTVKSHLRVRDFAVYRLQIDLSTKDTKAHEENAIGPQMNTDERKEKKRQ